ncbi:hypothetical protein AB0D13_23385 [Streptomyces sp. NPDC048430]|uniref:hypothetical protein n=1 Tax=Streptomyces sp. NPDC048430 TaxID=3155388 RepID=UPI00341594D7
MPRTRPGRVRTKHTNRRAPLLLSTMAPEDYNVRPNEVKSIACPDCHTWRRIMGDTVLKIRPHDITDKVAEGEKPTACLGSEQLVIVDIDIRRWQARQDRLLCDAMPQDNRRAARQFYKPVPTPATPVSRLRAEVTLETTRQTYLAHRKGCTRCTGRQHCTDGGMLARRYVLALTTERRQSDIRQDLERKQQRAARTQAQNWPAVRSQQWAKHGGAAVERANNTCAERLPGAHSEFHGPGLPA